MNFSPILIANWKMNNGLAQTKQVLQDLVARWPKRPAAELTICPAFTSLETASRVLKNSNIALGAQDLFWEDRGAFTGEVSAPMLQELGCRSVIVGHSERRQHLAETDAMVRRKVISALAHGLDTVLCIGEPAEVKRSHRTALFLERQLRASLPDFISIMKNQRLIVAYEPIWAIGTGSPLDPAEAAEPIDVIQTTLMDLCGSAMAAGSVDLIYGGSVTPSNVADYVSDTGFHGVLVGSASLASDALMSFEKNLKKGKITTKKPR